ncbi:MAG TPA: DMT family transporter, partial [Acetobacteraceae bacterium]|nr:DMT family transporter [Acetobacteraceae bacterium]
ILLTFVAMAAFAANSLLARAALGDGAIDAASFTAIRLVSGAVALVLLTLLQSGTASWRGKHGNWPCAFALFAYAFAFSLAYLRLGAATGALILFTSVQGTMIAWSIGRGEHPTGPEITGLAIAFAAFVYLLLPGLNTPDLAGSLLMMTAGIAWGVYSIRGRGARNPLGETAGNFLRTVAFCIPLALLIVARGHTTTAAIALAVLSGSLTSGVGYAIWYRALPHLSGSQAATVQLTVPILAALGAVMFLSEPLTLRLAVASVCILGGVALAIASRRTAVPR